MNKAKQAAKHEALLKEVLSRSENRKCVDCEALVGPPSKSAAIFVIYSPVKRVEGGTFPFTCISQRWLCSCCCLQRPQYVVAEFWVFVCAECGGVQ